MKMFSDCSGDCVTCTAFGGACLAGHGDDDYVQISAEVARQRYRLGETPGSHGGGGRPYNDAELAQLARIAGIEHPAREPEHPRVGVAAIVTRGDGKVLMGKRRGAHGEGTWSFPGGSMEYGEDPLETARRELLEETGMLPSGHHRETMFTNDVFRAEGLHYITIFVILTVPAQQRPRVREPDKCEGWEWFSWDDMPPHDRLFLPIRNLLRTGYRPPL